MKYCILLLMIMAISCHALCQSTFDHADHFNEAQKYERQENFSKSLHHYNKAVELKNDFMEGYYNRALLLKKMNIPKEAILDYKEVLKLDPVHPRAYGSMAALKIQLKDFNGALADLDKQLQINAKDMIALTNRGICLLMLGKRKNACNDWRRAEKLGSREAQTLLSKYGN